MANEITKFMIGEHGKILALFLKFKKEKSEDSFNLLNSSLKRHVLAEEKAIMMLQSRGASFSEMTIILEQHEEIESLMKKIDGNLTNSSEDLKVLLGLMKEHIQLENKKFYPKLDKELDEKERKVIYDKLHEAIIGNIMV